MKSIKSKVLVSFLALALVMTSVFTPSVSAEAASKKAVKTVTLKVNGKKMNKKTKTITVGKSITVKTSVTPSSAKKSITYKSSNKKVATVSSKGKVKAIKAGTTKITVKVKGKNNRTKSAWFKVKVVNKAKATATPTPTTKVDNKVAVTSVTLDATSTVIGVDGGVQIASVILPTNASDKNLTYTSSNAKVATVSNTGLVTGKAEGTTTITAKSANGVYGTIQINVKKIEPTSMSLNVNSLDLTVGETSLVAAVFTPANANVTNVKWASANEKVAKVDNGTVTAIGVGSTKIVATSTTGLMAETTVNVKAKSNANADGVTISVANSLEGYNNTVFTGNNADVRVSVFKDGKPVGNTDVTLRMEYKAGTGDFWYIGNEQSDVTTVKTNDQGIANFTVSLKTKYKKYDATDDVTGGYLLTATATGASTKVKAPLTFATFKAGDVVVNRIPNTLAQGENASKLSVVETVGIERRIIDIEDKTSEDSEVVGTSEYVVSQQVSTLGEKEHAVTFNAYPLIAYPQVIASSDDADYKQPVGFECEGYSVYDSSQFKYQAKVPTNLNYATLNFDSLTISKNTALKIAVYKDYDEKTYEPIGAALKTYAIKGEHIEEDFSFQIPIQELSKLIGTRDYVCIKVWVESQGQIEVKNAIGFSWNNITGNYIATEKYNAVSEVYKNAKIDWVQVQKGKVGSDPYKYASYQSKVTMSKELALEYGIDTISKDSPYYKATVEYKIPTYPHIGDAYVVVKKPNEAEKNVYFMIPTTVVNNENVLLEPSKTVQAFEVSEKEALNYVGSIIDVAKDGSYVTVNSVESGITEVYGWLTVDDLDLTIEERRLFGYVNWAPIPKVQEKEVKDFYALIGQTIKVEVSVKDKNNINPVRNTEIEFYLGDSEEKLKKEDMPNGVTITGDASKFDAEKTTVMTDGDGYAYIAFNSNSYLNDIKELYVKDGEYNVTLSVAGTEAEAVNLHWIAPGLSFTDRAAVSSDEVKDKIGETATKTVAYGEADNKETIETIEQEKKINTDWLIGYQVVGLVKEETEEGEAKYKSAKDAAAVGYSNVLISGVKMNIDYTGSTVDAPLGEEVAKNEEKGTIQIRSASIGNDLIRGSIKTIPEDAKIEFKLLDDYGNVIDTVKNVGLGEASVSAGLSIPIKWSPVSVEYDIETPSGNSFIAGADQPSEKVYVKVSDGGVNMLDGYLVTYSVKKTVDGKTTEVIPATEDTSKNGLIPIELVTPSEACTYHIHATINGYGSTQKTITYDKRLETTVDFAMKKATVVGNKVTIELTDKVNADTVVKEMFGVKDSTKNRTYEVTDAQVSNTGREIVLTLKDDSIQATAEYINITYSSVKEDITSKVQTRARRMVSVASVPMTEGFVVTAYTGNTPDVAYDSATGKVTGKTDTLPNGAYVVFVYGNKGTIVKSVEVTGNAATDATAATYDSVTVFTGAKSTSYVKEEAVNAPAVVEEEVVETVVETEATEEEVAEATEEETAETTEETAEANEETTNIVEEEAEVVE